jgi:Na+/H+ antiporter NhaA
MKGNMNTNTKKVLACVDGSASTPSVADWAIWSALRLDTPLEFLHVVDRHSERGPSRDLSGSLGMDAQEPWVAFLIVPIFGFANAGVSVLNVPASMLLDPVPLGVGLGLFLGKQVGIFGMAVLAIKMRLAVMPSGATWGQLYGTSVLCGIGFTMSLFIGLLAFAGEPILQDETKLGVLIGSAASAICGALALKLLARNPSHQEASALKVNG